MILRQALLRDVSRMAAVDAVAGPFPWGEQRLQQALAGGAGAEALAIEPEDDKKPGGIPGFILFSCGPEDGTVLNIAVHPDSQGKGLGFTLLLGAMRRMHASGMRRCLLEVRQSNAAARALYRSAGFVEDGVRKNYYPAAAGREDAVLLSRSLQGIDSAPGSDDSELVRIDE